MLFHLLFVSFFFVSCLAKGTWEIVIDYLNYNVSFRKETLISNMRRQPVHVIYEIQIPK